MMIKAGFQLEVGGGGEDCHMKGAGILVEYFGPTFFWPLKAITLNVDYITRVNKTNWKYIIFLPVQP